VAGYHAKAAKDRGCTFIPVLLICDADANAQRMRSQERLELVAGGKGMLLDTDLLYEIRSRGEILRFECPELLVLDVSGLAPEESANKIVQHMVALDVAALGSYEYFWKGYVICLFNYQKDLKLPSIEREK
jgi:hypothetical protein